MGYYGYSSSPLEEIYGYYADMVVVIFIIALIIRIMLAGYMKSAAEKKGYSQTFHVFVLVFIFGLFGCLYVIALPDLSIQNAIGNLKEYQQMIWVELHEVQSKIESKN